MKLNDMKTKLTKRDYYLIAVHIMAWVLFYAFNIGMISNAGFPIYYDYQFFNILIYMFIFYLNYYLVRRFLLDKQFLIYTGFAIVLLGLGILGKIGIDSQFEERFRQDMPRMEKKEFKSPQPGERPPRPGQGPDRRFDRPPENMRNFFDMKKMIGISYSLLFFFFLSLTMQLVKKWLEEEKIKSQLETEKVETELAYLKQQINPHFLFNSLNSIYSLSITKSEQTTPSILKLSSILRYLLYDSGEKAASLEEELNVVRDYIELQKLRLTEKVQVNLEIEGEPEDYLFEPFIILPIIENAFKYGVDNLNNSYIKIKLKIQEEYLILFVENQVVHRPAIKRKGSGIGLKNIKRRLEILYPDDHNFSSNESNEVFSVDMKIKLKRK
jgi:hypothetical protein